MRDGIWGVAVGCAVLVMWGCGERDESRNREPAPDVAARSESAAPADDAAAPETLEVAIVPKSGSTLQGTARLEQRSDGVFVSVDLANAPVGRHGLHVHETADCSAPDAESAGEHFNPSSEPHGLPPAEPRHLGDLGNIEVTEQGGQLQMLVPGATLATGDPQSLLDRAIVVHANEDSGAQPSGDAGDRIGCGEIRGARAFSARS